MGCSGVFALAVMVCLAPSGQAECDDQPLCPAGKGEKAGAAEGGTTVADCCADCVEGTTYSSQSNTQACLRSLVNCPAGQFKTASTVSQDTTCTACQEGKYSKRENDDTACDDCSGSAQCDAGSYYNEAGDACMSAGVSARTADTTTNTNTCRNCGAGKYVAAATETACKDQEKRGRVFRGSSKPPGPLPVRSVF